MDKRIIRVFCPSPAKQPTPAAAVPPSRRPAEDELYAHLSRIHSTTDGPEYPRIDLAKPKKVWRIGRGAECEIRLESSLISTVHCIIEHVRDEAKGATFLAISDNNSSNGVWVNNVLLEEDEKLWLRNGDVIALASNVTIQPGKENWWFTYFEDCALEGPSDVSAEDGYGESSVIETRPSPPPKRSSLRKKGRGGRRGAATVNAEPVEEHHESTPASPATGKKPYSWAKEKAQIVGTEAPKQPRRSLRLTKNTES